MKAPHQLEKALEDEGLAASERHLQGAGARHVGEEVERGDRRPQRSRALVPRAERAREVAVVAQRELKDARRHATQVRRLRSIHQRVPARVSIEQEQGPVERVGPHVPQRGGDQRIHPDSVSEFTGARAHPISESVAPHERDGRHETRAA